MKSYLWHDLNCKYRSNKVITRNNNTDWNATTAYVSTTRILQVTFKVVVSSSINLVSLPYCVCWNSFCFKLLFTRLFEVSLNPREFPYVLKRMQKFCLPLFNNIKPICAMWPQLKVHLEQFLSFSSFKERDDLLAFLSVMKEILFAQFLENIRLKLKKMETDYDILKLLFKRWKTSSQTAIRLCR